MKATDASAPELRRREIAMIKVAQKQLGMDDATYRDMLELVTGKRSAADLDWQGRKKVIDHLKAKGFSIKSKRRADPASYKAELVSKIKAQLMSFTPPRADFYADGMSRQMFGVERYTWCDPQQLHKIVAALAYAQKRDKALRQANHAPE
ncbi:MAG: regulatory protein GemA [Sterolibacterium sp.]